MTKSLYLDNKTIDFTKTGSNVIKRDVDFKMASLSLTTLHRLCLKLHRISIERWRAWQLFSFFFFSWGVGGSGRFFVGRGRGAETCQNGILSWPSEVTVLICEHDLYQTPPCPVNIPLCSNVTGKVRFSSCAVMPWHTLLPVPSTFDRDDGNEKDIKKINGGANYCNTLDFIVVNLVGVYIYKWYLYLLKEYVQYYMYKSRECVCILPCTVVYQVTDSAIYLGPFLCVRITVMWRLTELCAREMINNALYTSAI